jgi:hypothetical protein
MPLLRPQCARPRAAHPLLPQALDFADPVSTNAMLALCGAELRSASAPAAPLR